MPPPRFPAHMFVVFMLFAMVSVPQTAMSAAPISSQPQTMPCNVVWSLITAPTGPLSLFPFVAVTVDMRTRSTGAYYIVYSGDNPVRHGISRLMSYDLGVQGVPGNSNRNVVLAGTNAPVVPGNAPVAHQKWVLYDFGATRITPTHEEVPLIAYGIGFDSVPGTADDIGIVPIVPDHAPGPTLKDVAANAMIYVVHTYNATGIANDTVILHYMGPNGKPDFPPGTGDDTIIPLAHLNAVTSPETQIIGARVSTTGKFSVLFADRTLHIYDIGANNLYENGLGDDSWLTLTSFLTSEHDLSPNGRYIAMSYTTPPYPTQLVGVMDIGPDGRVNTPDDAMTVIGTGTMPKVDDFDPAGRIGARLIYLTPYFNLSAIAYINAGADAIFGNADDQRQLIPLASNVALTWSLQIAGDMITWEDYAQTSAVIRAYHACI